MRIEVEEAELYKYSELSSEAQNKAKEILIEEDRDPDYFEDTILEQLATIFPNSNLKVQFSLNSCQGDGVNIYGDLDTGDLYNFIAKSALNKEYEVSLEDIKEMLSDKITKITIPYNRSYSYSMADYVDFDCDFFQETFGTMSTFHAIQSMTKQIISQKCSEYEKDGYDYFYEMSDEEASDICDVQGYEFTEDGDLYN